MIATMVLALIASLILLVGYTFVMSDCVISGEGRIIIWIAIIMLIVSVSYLSYNQALRDITKSTESTQQTAH